MEREIAPDENTRFEMWDSVIIYVKSTIEKAKYYPANAMEKELIRAKNALDGVPDSHPQKRQLMNQIMELITM